MCVFRCSVWGQIESQKGVTTLESRQIDTAVQSCGMYARLLEQPGVGLRHVACNEVGFDFNLLIFKLNHGLPDVVVLEVERVLAFTGRVKV